MALDLTNWILVFVRAGALLALFPVFSSQNFPVQLRIGLSALLAFLVSPALAVIDPATLDLWGLVGLITLELFVGLLFGFISRMVFYAIDFAGTFIAAEIGLNMTGDFNPFNNARSEAPGLILYYLALMLFLTLDLHHWLIAAFQRTYTLLPVGGVHLREEVALEILARAGHMFVVAVQMAAPIIAVAFLINLVFSLLGRAVPQMNVFSESFAFRNLAGLVVFGLTLNLMAQHLSNYLRRLPEDILRVAQLLSSA